MQVGGRARLRVCPVHSRAERWPHDPPRGHCTSRDGHGHDDASWRDLKSCAAQVSSGAVVVNQKLQLPGRVETDVYKHENKIFPSQRAEGRREPEGRKEERRGKRRGEGERGAKKREERRTVKNLPLRCDRCTDLGRNNYVNAACAYTALAFDNAYSNHTLVNPHWYQHRRLSSSLMHAVLQALCRRCVLHSSRRDGHGDGRPLRIRRQPRHQTPVCTIVQRRQEPTVWGDVPHHRTRRRHPRHKPAVTKCEMTRVRAEASGGHQRPRREVQKASGAKGKREGREKRRHQRPRREVQKASGAKGNASKKIFPSGN